jgi:maltooligosyltrehalose trehalohydrolase
MLFQGQEFAASSPFLYFADHNAELAELVAAGRAQFLRQFPSIASPEAHALLANPEKEETFLRCKLNFAERELHGEFYRLHQDLIALRKRDPSLSHARPGSYDGATLGLHSFVIRYFGAATSDRLLIVNLGPALRYNAAPEPLLAPPARSLWRLTWSSEDPRYGGWGTPPVENEHDNWRIPADCAVLLTSTPSTSP